MLESCEKIRKFIDNMNFNEFVADDKTHYAVTRAFEILGEAANKVSEPLKQKSKDIPWPNIIAMRNLLIHVYHNADLDVVWFTAKEKLPTLELRLREILESQRKD
jgi:uncharacterized protein with HEPN domain